MVINFSYRLGRMEQYTKDFGRMGDSMEMG